MEATKFLKNLSEFRNMKTLSLISHKGGVGKTSIAVNMAYYLTSLGYNICLIDGDFHGPSLMTFFPPPNETLWINEYLMGNCDLEKCLVSHNFEQHDYGKLLLSFADPTPESIDQVIRIDKNTSMKMLHYFMKMKKSLNEDYKIDFLIIDCSPGTGFSTINMMVISELVLFIVKINNADLEGTAFMVEGLHKQIKHQKSFVLANQIPPNFIEKPETNIKIQKLVEDLLNENLNDSKIEFLGWLPLDPELPSIEFTTAVSNLMGKNSKRLIHIRDQPSNAFSKVIQSISHNIFGINKS